MAPESKSPSLRDACELGREATYTEDGYIPRGIRGVKLNTVNYFWAGTSTEIYNEHILNSNITAEYIINWRTNDTN